MRHPMVLSVVIVIMLPSNLVFGSSSPSEKENEHGWSNRLETGATIPLNGTIYLNWSRPISKHLEMSSYLAYFNREWMVLLEKGDWHSHSVYLGTMLKYYPTVENHTQYYVGGDVGIATSYQTYNPTNKGDVFWFPYIELYFLGWVFPIYEGLLIDLCAGGGYAPVSEVVEIDGHRNEGDFYVLLDLRIGYQW